MRWRFWRREHAPAAAAPPSVTAPPAPRGRTGRDWTALPVLRTTIHLTAPTLVPVLRAPAVAGTRSLLHRRRPRRRSATDVLPPVPSGQAAVLLAVHEAPSPPPAPPALPEPEPADGPLDLPVATPVVVPEPPRPAFTAATDDYVGAPVEPATPFHSVTEFERMMWQYTDTAGGFDLASMIGFSSSAAPPPMPAPATPKRPSPADQVLQRPTLAQSRRLGLRPTPGTEEPAAPAAAPTLEPQAIQQDELLLDPAAGPVPPTASPVPPANAVPSAKAMPPANAMPSANAIPPAKAMPSANSIPHANAVPPANAVPLANPGQRRLGLGAPLIPGQSTVERRLPVRPAARPRKAAATSADRGEPDDAEHHPVAPTPGQAVAETLIELPAPEPPAIDSPVGRPLAAQPLTTIEPALPPGTGTHHETQALSHRAPPPPPPPSKPLASAPAPPVSLPGPVYRAPLAAMPPAVAHEDTWHEHEQEIVPPELASTFMTTFGVDVGSVPVHRGRSVSRQAHALEARAFTRAGQVFLPDEAGELTGPQAMPLLAHELVHAAQQRILGDALPGEESADGRELEAAAVAAEHWARGEAAPPLTLVHRRPPPAQAPPVPPDVVQRAEPDAVSAFLEMAAQEHRTDEAPPAPAQPQPTTIASWSANPAESPLPITPPTAPPVSAPHAAQPARSSTTDDSVHARLDDLTAAVAGLTGSDATTVLDLEDRRTLDDLADRLYGRLRSRLRTELLVDRERAGILADRR